MVKTAQLVENGVTLFDACPPGASWGSAALSPQSAAWATETRWPLLAASACSKMRFSAGYWDGLLLLDAHAAAAQPERRAARAARRPGAPLIAARIAAAGRAGRATAPASAEKDALEPPRARRAAVALPFRSLGDGARPPSARRRARRCSAVGVARAAAVLVIGEAEVRTRAAVIHAQVRASLRRPETRR